MLREPPPSQALDNSKRSIHQPQYLNIYSSTKGIIFLGTPHRGSGSAGWGLLASNLAKVALQGPNERILKGLTVNSELLENLMQVFLQMLEDGNFQIHSFFETKPMIGLYGLRDRVQTFPPPPPSLAPRKNHEQNTDQNVAPPGRPLRLRPSRPRAARGLQQHQREPPRDLQVRKGVGRRVPSRRRCAGGLHPGSDGGPRWGRLMAGGKHDRSSRTTIVPDLYRI